MKINRPIISILSGRIAPAFFAPDTGGDGGTAAIDAAPPAAPAGGDANADIISFEPPDPDAVMRSITSTTDALEPVPAGKKEVAPKPEPAKPPAKKEEPPKPTPPAKKEGEAPIAQLRSEYEATKAKLAEAEKKLEAGDPRLKQFEADVEAARKELQQERDTAKSLREKLVEYDAENDEEIQRLKTDWNKKAATFHSRVRAVPPEKVWELAGELNAIPITDAAKMAEFTAKVNLALGGTDEENHPQLEKVLDHIEATRDFAVAKYEKTAAIKANAETNQIERSAKHYSAIRSRVDGLLAKAREVPDGMEETNPTHPAVVLAKVRKELGDDAKKFEEGIDEFTRLVLAGVPPRTAKDYAGMTAQQIAETRAEEAQRVEKARDYAANILPNAMTAYRVLPTLVREIARLRAKLGEDKISEPPDPSINRGEGGEKTNDDDLSTFRAPNLDDVNL